MQIKDFRLAMFERYKDNKPLGRARVHPQTLCDLLDDSGHAEVALDWYNKTSDGQLPLQLVICGVPTDQDVSVPVDTVVFE